jgi:hypothetical protein
MWINFGVDLRTKYNLQSKDFIYYDKPVSKNKSFSFQAFYTSPLDVLSLEISITDKQNHGGVLVNFSILGVCVYINLYDKRHWNYDENRYWNYDEPEGYE